MATLLDRFVVEFGLDPKDHTKGSNEVRRNTKRTEEDIEQGDKNIEGANKRATASFTKLRNEVAGLVLAFSGAKSMKGFLENIVLGDAAVYRMAHNLGATTQGLSAWGMALGTAGGDAEDAAQAFTLLANARDQLNTTMKTTGHDYEFRRLGITAEELNKGPEATLLAISERRGAGMKDDNLYAATLRNLGLSEAMITVLKRGRVAVSDLIEEQKRLGATTDDQGKKAADFDKALAGLANRIKGDMRPAVDGAAGALAAFDKNTDLAALAVPVLEGVIGSLAAGVLLANVPLVLMAAAITAIAVAIEKVNAASTHSGDGSFWGTFKNGWENINAGWFERLAESDRTNAVALEAKGDKAGAAKKWADFKEHTNQAALWRQEQSRSYQDGQNAAAGTPAPTPGEPGGTPTKALPAERSKWRDKIKAEALRRGATPEEVAALLALAEHESTFDPNALGHVMKSGAHKGDRAVGLFQYMASSAKGWNRLDPSAQVSNGVRIFLENSRKYGVQGALAIQQSGNPKAGQPGGPDPADGNQHTSQFLAAVNSLSAKYMPGAQAAPVVAAQAAAPSPERTTGAGAPVTNVTTVGTVMVYTAATDAKGIADELPGAITNRGLTTQANRGME